MTYDEYAKKPGLNFSTIKHMRNSPKALHAIVNADPRDGDTDSRAMLRLQHALVLEPEVVDRDFAFFTGKTARGTAWDEANAEADKAGQTLVKAGTPAKQRDIAAARAMAKAVRAHPDVAHALLTGETEIVVEGMDKEWGRIIKSRQDLLSPTWWLDMKDYGSTNHRHCGRRAWDLGAVHQAAFNRRCLIAAGRRLPEQWGLICVQSKPYIDVARLTIDPNDMDAADAELTTWVERLAECEASGEWPGNGDGMLDLPGYAFAPDIDDFTFREE